MSKNKKEILQEEDPCIICPYWDADYRFCGIPIEDREYACSQTDFKNVRIFYEDVFDNDLPF